MPTCSERRAARSARPAHTAPHMCAHSRTAHTVQCGTHSTHTHTPAVVSACACACACAHPRCIVANCLFCVRAPSAIATPPPLASALRCDALRVRARTHTHAHTHTHCGTLFSAQRRATFLTRTATRTVLHGCRARARLVVLLPCTRARTRAHTHTRTDHKLSWSRARGRRADGASTGSALAHAHAIVHFISGYFLPGR